MSEPLVVTDSTAIHHVQLAFLLSPTSSHSITVKYRNQLWSAYYYIMCKMQFFNYIHVQLKSVSETMSANENESSKKCLRSAFFAISFSSVSLERLFSYLFIYEFFELVDGLQANSSWATCAQIFSKKLRRFCAPKVSLSGKFTSNVYTIQKVM